MSHATLTTLANEEWRPVKGFEGRYEVSNMGRVRSLDRLCIRKYKDGHITKHTIKGLLLKQRKNHGGYYLVSLSDGHRRYTTFQTHRLVALHFVDGYKPGLVVNHINEIKTDNRASNLEWCTYQYNLRYSDVIAWKRKTVYQYDLNGNLIAKHRCCGDIEDMLGVYRGAMTHVMYESKRKQWKGYLWSYEPKTKEEWDIIKKMHKPSHKEVAQYSLDGVEVARYKTATDAASALGVSLSAVSRCCLGKCETVAGYICRYTE